MKNKFINLKLFFKQLQTVSVTLNNDNNDNDEYKTFYISSNYDNLNDNFFISEFIDDKSKLSNKIMNIKKEKFNFINYFNSLIKFIYLWKKNYWN